MKVYLTLLNIIKTKEMTNNRILYNSNFIFNITPAIYKIKHKFKMSKSSIIKIIQNQIAQPKIDMSKQL